MTVLRHLIFACAAMVLIGGHWGVLQGIAWTRMAITYSQESGWVQGIKQTFDGSRPCTMCVTVKEGREQESEQIPPGLQLKKFEISPLVGDCALAEPPCADRDWERPLSVYSVAWGHPPEGPVPRSQA